MDNLESIEQAANNLLSKGIKDDLATGSTPRKRKWQFTDEWTLTRSRDELLNSRRRRTPPGDDHEMQSERLASTESENEVPHIEVPHSTTKVESLKTEFTVEPLVESRRRNVSTTRRASRRAR
jgi:kinesin family protein 11